MLYDFITTCTMKEYNQEKWFICSDIIPRIEIESDSLKDALLKYRGIVEEKHYITISKTALKNKSNMYRDTKTGTKQIGYVITGATEFQHEITGDFTKQYIDLWIEIKKTEYVSFDEI